MDQCKQSGWKSIVCDDISRFTAIFFMKSKYQVLQKFKEFEAMATNATEQKIKNLHKSGVYSSKELNDFLIIKGFSKKRSIIPKTPEHNEIKETMNRIIQDCKRDCKTNAACC